MGRASRRKKEGQPEDKARASEPIVPPEYHNLDSTDWILLTLVIILSLAVYARTLCPTIFTTGAGENVTAVVTLGIPHPPGFPLYILLAKIFTYAIPFGISAFRVNFFTAICGSAATGMLYALCRSFVGPDRRFAAVAVALLFAFSQTFWSQAVIAEVYTLNALLLISIFFLLIRWEKGGSLWPVALFAGLGLTVHPLQALFFPGWLYFIWRSHRRTQIDSEEIKKCLASFAGGFCFHLYPLLRSKANPPLDWGNPENLKNLIAYLTASQYQGRMFTLPFASVVKNAGKGFQLLLEQFTPWLCVLPIAGAVLLFRKHRRLFIVTLLSFLLTFFYAINYNIPWEIDVYYIPIVLIAAFWCLWLFERIPSKFTYALPILAVLPLILNYHHNDRSKNRIALDYGIDLLTTVPDKAALVLPQTDAAFTVLYLTGAEKKRSDLNIWVITDDGVHTLRDGVNPDAPPVPIHQFLADHKMVFLAQRVTPETVPGYKQIPFGIVYILVKKEEKPVERPVDFTKYLLEKNVKTPPAFYLDDRNRAVLASYYLSRGDNVLAAGNNSAAMHEYLRAEKLGEDLSEIRSQLGLRFAEIGNKPAAIAQLRASIQLNESAGDQNRLGRLLAESGRTDEAMTAFIRAIQLDPKMASAYSNLGAILGIKGDMRRAVQALENALTLDPRDPKTHNNLAAAYMKSGKKAAAIAHWKTSLNIDPEQPQIRKQLEQLNVE